MYNTYRYITCTSIGYLLLHETEGEARSRGLITTEWLFVHDWTLGTRHFSCLLHGQGWCPGQHWRVIELDTNGKRLGLIGLGTNFMAYNRIATYIRVKTTCSNWSKDWGHAPDPPSSSMLCVLSALQILDSVSYYILSSTCPLYQQLAENRKFGQKSVGSLGRILECQRLICSSYIYFHGNLY